MCSSDLTGSFLDSDEYEMISSPDIPEAATFGVYVEGDSMEPIYHNKDLIWIEQTACLDDVEIGIFYLVTSYTSWINIICIIV